MDGDSNEPRHLAVEEQLARLEPMRAAVNDIDLINSGRWRSAP
jgi:hypothetical protein